MAIPGCIECGVCSARRQLEVHAVAELVGQRHHVPQAIGVIEQDEGPAVLRHRGAECPAPLSRAWLGVDAVLGVELVGDRPDLRREGHEPVADDLAGLGVVDLPPLAERRVLVVELQPIDAEQRRLVREPSLRDVATGLDGAHHRLDHTGVELVREVPGVHRAGVSADPVRHETVGDERVVAVGEDRRLRLERGVERVKRTPPQRAVG